MSNCPQQPTKVLLIFSANTSKEKGVPPLLKAPVTVVGGSASIVLS